MPLYDFDATLLGLIKSTVGVERLQPLHLGGAQGPAGGVGGPPGGFIGNLPQWRVAYDQSEQATFATLGSGIAPSGIMWPSGAWATWASGIPSLWDNLNHMRARIEECCSGISVSGLSAIDVELNGIPQGEGDTLNFIEGSGVTITVTDMGDTVDIQFDCTASGVGADELVKVSANDIVARYLGQKITTATGPISTTETNDGGDEDLEFDWAWGQVVTVMKSGGDYNVLSTAMAAITDAGPTNRYLILVGPDLPGTGDVVTLKSYVDICGFGWQHQGSNSQGSTQYILVGGPTDVTVTNLRVSQYSKRCIALSGGNVRFVNCLFHHGNVGDSGDDKRCVIISGGTHQFFNCHATTTENYPTAVGGAYHVTGGTVDIFGGYVETQVNTNNHCVYCSAGTVRLHGAVRLTASVGKDLYQAGTGSIHVFSAEYNPDAVTGTITGADKDFVVGDLTVIDDLMLNGISHGDAEPFDAHLNNPACRAYHNANQNIAHNILTALIFNTEDWDTDSIHSTVANTDRMTCQTAGKYLITCSVGFTANVAGRRMVHIRAQQGAALNYYATDNRYPTQGGFSTITGLSTVVDLAVGDYVQIAALQTSGGILAILAGENQCNVTMTRVAT